MASEPEVLSWAEAAAGGPQRCGGKGWSLGRLHQLGFPVPAGGVLTTAAYLRFLSDPELVRLQERLASVSPADVLQPEVGKNLQAMQAALRMRPLPAEVRAAVDNFLRRQRLGETRLAVRSSAAAEDSAAASFAGIHQSFLDCVGLAAVLAAIQGCYASLWTPQALAYRRRLGLPDAAVACAVVLCVRIEARRAGVAFSCDPRSGRRDQVRIAAVEGMGEALVSGRVNPEEITVSLHEGELCLPRQPGRLLTPQQTLTLARLVWRIHWALGDGEQPQDVEWVHDGACFWLVQARPVTRLPRVGFAELGGQPIYWSNANVKEVLPGVPTALSWSIIQPALWFMLFAAPQAAGYRLPPGMHMARRIRGRLYFDLTALQWVFYDCFGVPPADSNRSIGGHQPEITVPAGSPFRGRAGLRRQGARLRLLLRLLPLPQTVRRLMRQVRAQLRAALQVDLRVLSGPQLVTWLFDVGRTTRPLGTAFMLVAGAAELWRVPLITLLEGRIPGRGQALTSALMAASGQVTSAAQGYGLFDLAEAARQDEAARAYLAQEPLDPFGWRQLPPQSPFRRRLERFLHEFGHRAVYEVEIANPRWNEDPTFLLEQVRTILSAPAVDPRQAAQKRRAEAEAEVARHTWMLRPLVRWLAHQARQASALREEGKSVMIASWWPLRRGVLETGRRLVEAGQLDDPADAFHLTWVDITTYLCAEWSGAGARALVALRRSQRDKWLAEEAPDVLAEPAEGTSAPLSALPSIAGVAAGSAVQVGVAASSGRASGRARILRHPHEGGDLRSGEVLVAPSTDPAWAPLFLRAAALVMEVGGYLSHGAIVAREYGIPAVVNVPGVLQWVRDGEVLTVDGDQGRVIRESPEVS